MYLFFDTETTGLPRRWNAPVTDVDNWPRLVQLAWIVCDAEGQTLRSRNAIIQPDGFLIPAAVAKLHGITTVMAREQGLPLREVMEEFAGEMCMISTQPDRVLVLKAVEGKGADVEAALNDVLSSIQAEAGFYPMNAAKANAAKVLRHGDYVCLLLVGAMDETSQTEEEAAAFAEEQVQIGVNAVNALFE